MKKILLVLLALLLACSAAFLGTCSKETPNSSNKEETKKNTAVLGAIEDLAEFTIVRSENSSSEETAIASSFCEKLNTDFGADVRLKTDFGGEAEKEILLGFTNRKDSKALVGALTYNEYVIKRVGNKIIICGGSVDALSAAVDLWTTKMVNKSGKLCIPGDEKGYFFSHDSKLIDNLTIDGASIMDYTVVSDSPAFASIAIKIADVIFDIADVKLEVIVAPGYEIPDESKLIRIGNVGSDNKRSSFAVVDSNIEITPAYYDADWSVNYIKMLLDGAVDRKLDITSYHNTDAIYELGEIYSKEDVLAVINKVYNSDELIVGTEITNGVNQVSNTLENYYEKSGQYPGILGLDVRYANLVKLGEEGGAKVVADLTRFAEGGGLVTASAHFSNPVENGGDPAVENYCGRLGGDDAWAALITEGTDYNKSFKQELSGIADFFEALERNGVPVIWRPLHEANGNWFWFCMVQGDIKVSEASFRKLWRYIHDYFTIERGLDNLLWEYSPNIGNESSSMTAPLYGFPGKDYVDLVGFDWYTGDANVYILESSPTYSDLLSLGMGVNITEFGPSGNLVADAEGEIQEDIFSCESILGMFEEIKRSGKDYKFGYFLTWTSNISIPELGKSKEFMDYPMTLGQADVKALFDELK